MSTFVSLMYHAIYDGESELKEIDAKDRPYAVSLDQFKQHLDIIEKHNITVVTSSHNDFVSKDLAIQITFDDGHVGWHKHVMPLFLERGIAGVFFVTSDFIGTPSFCSKAQLRDLSESGNILGSHGKTHSFLADLNSEECANELKISKAILEDITGSEVDTISFPGGRYVDETLRLCEQLGYKQLYTSVPGINRLNERQLTVRRIDIKRDTSIDVIEKLVVQDSLFIGKLRSIAFVKRIIKKLAGNGLYDKVYRLVYGSKKD